MKNANKKTTVAAVAAWLDRELKVGEFDDVSNNGVQISGDGRKVTTVAFAVDASAKSVRAAAASGAQMLVVHHGISWGGGIRRISGGVYNVIKAAMDSGLAVYASHLPLDANEKYGNNFNLARYLGLKKLRRAFSYHGNVIGVIGENAQGVKVGVCSGGAGSFAEEAKELGCELYVTGEADWGEQIAAENAGAKMILAGHYETETFGVKALMPAVQKRFGVKTIFIDS